MSFIKKHWLLIVLFIISFILFSFKLSASASFEGDLGRDLFEIARISYGKMTLLGPKGSFGGIYTTPYYFYLFVPAFLAAGRGLSGVLFFNALMFSSALVYFSFLASKKFGKLIGFLCGLTMMVFPYFILAARNPGNGFTPLAFFLIFLSIIYFYDLNKFSLPKIFSVGFLLGFIISMLFVYATVGIPILVWIFILLKDKKKFLLLLAGVAFAFSPLLLFELKNHFIMFKNTFIDKSYLSFINNTNLPNGVKLNKNIFANAIDLSKKMLPYFGINIFLVFSILAICLTWLTATAVVSFIFLAFLLRFQYSGHYLLPFLTLLSFALIIAIAHSRYKITLLILIISLLFSFPKNVFQKAARNYQLVKNRAEKTIAKNWLKNNDSFDVLLIRSDDAPTPAGFEYRYFLLKKGFKPQSEFLYKSSQKLLVFSEKKDLDFTKIKNWEMTEFDYSKVKNKYLFNPDNGMTVYLLEK